jgi:hypothetical protein
MKKTRAALIAIAGIWLSICISCRQESVGDESKIILTPSPSASVRINGAKIFGVRPGSPSCLKYLLPAKSQ